MPVLKHIERHNDYFVDCDSGSPHENAILDACTEGWLNIISKERIEDSGYWKDTMPIKRYRYYLELTQDGHNRILYDEL